MYGDLNSAPDDQEQLADLRWHWDLAYEINLCGGTWTARFLDWSRYVVGGLG